MEMKLQLLPTWEQTCAAQDRLELVKLIRGVLHKKDGAKQTIIERVEANKALYLCFQFKGETNASYLQRFQAHLEVAQTAGGTAGNCDSLAKQLMGKNGISMEMATRDDVLKYSKQAQTRYTLALLFTGLDNERYKKLKDHTKNQL